MQKNKILFVAVTNYENLGVGYLQGILQSSGYDTQVYDISMRNSQLLRYIRQSDPLIIGFSIIFLNHLPRFIEIIKYLRDEGVSCHFTAGGHYASLRYDELFNQIPWLDSIIRFDGEYPLLNLANKLKEG